MFLLVVSRNGNCYLPFMEYQFSPERNLSRQEANIIFCNLILTTKSPADGWWNKLALEHILSARVLETILRTIKNGSQEINLKEPSNNLHSFEFNCNQIFYLSFIFPFWWACICVQENETRMLVHSTTSFVLNRVRCYYPIS